ncbi:MAG: hypothetical protein JXA93_11280 [Anaerolineae bacterium]|nr:hypothetical protein [Anaerolineae bacterium]
MPGEREATIAARLRAPVPAGVAPAYVRAYTRPGDLVLIPYCQDTAAVRDVVAEGRRAVALNFDPLMVLLTRASLAPPSRRELDAAITRLGDSPKQGLPLRRYLDRLYATTCPACLRPAIASEFIWDREAGVPVAKQLQCPACSWDGRTAADAEDHTRLSEVQPRGMHYYFVLDRLAPRGSDARLKASMEKMLALYSSRNLYALAELTMKVETLFDAGSLRDALKVLLLDCLDRCSALAPADSQDESRLSPRQRLAVQSRFVERNVWLAFEQAAGRFMALAGAPIIGLTLDPAQVLATGGEWSAYTGQHVAREAGRLVRPGSLHLLLTAPPLLDPPAWSLAYLWGAWLLGSEVVTPLRPLLQKRTADASWYAQGLVSSFQSFARLLAADGRLVFVLDDRAPAAVEGLLTAAGLAGSSVVSMAHSGAGHRLVVAPGALPPASVLFAAAPAPGSPELDLAMEQVALHTAVETIRSRGEPTRWPALHAATWAALAQAGLLAVTPEAEGTSPLDRAAQAVRRARESPALLPLAVPDGGDPFYWLTEPVGLSSPLSDRVEAAAYDLLEGTLALTEIQFARALYERFPGCLVPDPGLVALALRSYAHEHSPGYWQLRAENGAAAREAERGEIIEQIHLLGQRLGYHAGAEAPFDVVWKDGQRWHALFAVRWQAVVSEVLLLGQAPAGMQRYLVLPGGRAALAAYKLAHNPVCQQAVDEAGWHFIKYRHVRQLAGEPDVDEYVLRTIVGLDPIVEREGVQIPLF